MICAKRPRILEDYSDDLIAIPQPRICDKCGQPALWAAPRQKTKGRHWGCIPGNTFWRCSEEYALRVVLMVAKAFPGCTISILSREDGLMDVGYTGPGEGPCALCGGAIRRYGERGLPLCRMCDHKRNGGTS